MILLCTVVRERRNTATNELSLIDDLQTLSLTYQMKSKGTAYLLWLIGFFGILGLQHFYLGKVVKGIVWLLTGGVFGFGAIVMVDSLRTAFSQR